MEHRSRARKLLAHIAAALRVQNRNPGCTACASPILDKNGKPILTDDPPKK